MHQYTDNELVIMFNEKQKSEQAFKLIVNKYSERLYWHIRKIVISHDDADDVLQNTLVKAWNGLKKFRQDSKLYTWLYRIATNESITLINKNKKSGYISLDDEDGLINTLEDSPFFDGDEAQRKFQKALLKLPEKQRLVFNMKYFDDMKYEEISEILETSVGALKASYHHAVKKIEKLLDED